MAMFSLFTLIFLFYFSPEIAAETSTQTYIVHVRPYSKSRVSSVDEDPELKLLPSGDLASGVELVELDEAEADDYYSSFLPFGIASQHDTNQMVHSYHNVLSGFAARLTSEDLKIMEQKDGFISARPEQKFQLHTTHTPNFLGLHPETGFWKESNFGKGVIVGLLDTGVFPSHPSFSDQDLSPPPAKWKGWCDFNVSDCNNKIIGARNLVTGFKNTAPVDDDGHGTHTASTAAGSFVKNAEVLGNAYGTAAGVAPRAHLAIYRVCSIEDCLESDILAGLDAAVEDGVDVISISIGVENPGGPFYLDNIAIGSFRAMQKGILVSCSAANSGPINSSLANDAPWILTVGASTMDRSIRTTAMLGNGKEFNGESLFQPKNFSSDLVPLVYAGADGKDASPFCAEGSLNGTDVRGKVVLCKRGGGNVTRIGKGEEVKRAGGAAMILMNDPLSAFSTEADLHVLPASHISFADGLKIMEYINSSSAPVATVLFKGTVIGSPLSPAVTSFSSRGPSIATPGILKPDIIGPGVSVLAAWPFPLGDSTSTSKATFNIISGTSMSCPHLAGVAALIKSSHPDWSPAAIKSAIMTTADVQNLGGGQILDQSLLPADLFATGAGHVNPSRADNPGLVYDIEPSDYVPYLCGLGYTDEQVGILAKQTIKCANQTKVSEGDLNYPSFSFKIGEPQTFSRVLTNVGYGNSSYEVEIVAPKGVDVSVEPKKLCFSKFNEKLRYSASLVLDGSDFKGPFAQGYLRWVSAEHSVRSPISVTF